MQCPLNFLLRFCTRFIFLVNYKEYYLPQLNKSVNITLRFRDKIKENKGLEGEA